MAQWGHRVRPGRQERRVHRDRREIPDKREQQAQRAVSDQQVLLALLVRQDLPEQLAQQVRLVLTRLARPIHGRLH